MLYRRASKILALLLCALPLLGCWDSTDIQDKNITTAVITDFDPDTGLYHFYVEIANISASANSNGKKVQNEFTVMHAAGTSFAEAKFDLDRQADNPIYLGATRVVFLTTRFAQCGIEEYINRIRGTQEYRKAVQLVTTPSTPEEIFNGESENNASTGFAVEQDVMHLSNDGQALVTTVGDLLQALAVKKAGFVVPQVIFEAGDVARNGYCVFKSGRMVGHLDGENSKGLVYLLNPDAKFIYEVEYNSAKITVEVKRKSLKVTPEWDGDKARFKVDLTVQASILYRSEDFPLTADLFDRFHARLNGLLADDIRKVIEAAQVTYQNDFLEFYKYFRARYPDAFDAMDWQDKFHQADIDLVIACSMGPYGLNDMQIP